MTIEKLPGYHRSVGTVNTPSGVTRRKFISILGGAALAVGGAYAAHEAGLFSKFQVTVTAPLQAENILQIEPLAFSKTALTEDPELLAKFAGDLNLALNEGSSPYRVGDLDMGAFKKEHNNNKNTYGNIDEYLAQNGITENSTAEQLTVAFNKLIEIPNFIQLIDDKTDIPQTQQNKTNDQTIVKNKEKLAQIYPLTLEKSLNESKGYFLLNAGTSASPVYLIQSRTQGFQIVSEGFGYALNILANYSLRLGADGGQEYQKLFDGLVRGMLLTLNKNGLPGWRCYHDAEKGVHFRSEYDTYSAVDADFYVASAMVKARELAERKIWKESAFDLPENRPAVLDNLNPSGWAEGREIPVEFNYSSLADFMVEGIKNFDVEEKGKRLILRVSDMWGGGNPEFRGGDIKGCITANDSYALLSEMYLLAKAYPQARDFFLKLRKDSFERILASYAFGQKLFNELEAYEEALKQDSEKKTIRLESEERRLLLNLLQKITPADSDLPMPAKKTGEIGEARKPEIKNGLRYEDDHLIVNEKEFQVYRDDSWEIKRGTFLFIMKKIREYGVRHFLPDQVEVETDKDGKTYRVRFERDAHNLDFTEGYDGVRVYAEIGKDLLLNNDSNDKNIPVQFRISAEEFVFLSSIIRNLHRNPQEVRAGSYHNAVAISSYFMAAAGTAAYSGKAERLEMFAKRLKGYDIFDPIDKTAADPKARMPQYYNSMLSLRIISEYLAQQVDLKTESGRAFEQRLERVKPRQEYEEINRYHEDFDFAVESFKLDWQRLKELLGGEKAKLSSSKISSSARLQKARKTKKEGDIFSGMSLVEAYMEAGAYHAALKEVFEILRDAHDQRFGLGLEQLNKAVKTMVDIMHIFRYPSPQISDLLEWLAERESTSSNKRRYLELALLHEYNEQRRVGMAEKVLARITAPSKVLGERWRHINVGKKGKNPLPRHEFIANLLAEEVFHIATTYEMADFVPAGAEVSAKEKKYQERKFNYNQAFSILCRLLGKDFPKGILESQEGEKLWKARLEEISIEKTDLKRIWELKRKGLTSNLKPRLLFSLGRILQQMAYDQKNSYENRGSYSDAWKNYIDKNINYVTGVYSQIINNTNLAIRVFECAIREENQKIQNPKFLAALFSSILDAYINKITVLVEKKEIIQQEKNKNPKYDAADAIGRIESELADTINKVKRISDNIQFRFDKPFSARFSAAGSNPFDQALLHMITSEEMRSPDPRNIDYINWIRKLLDFYVSAIANLRDTSYFASAMKLAAKITSPSIKIENRQLKALFVIESALKIADLLFNFRQIKKQDTGGDIEAVKKDIEVLFEALLGGSELKGVESQEVKSIYDFIKGNRSFIEDTFKSDPTLESKIFTAYGNLIWWGEDVETETASSSRERAIKKYLKALKSDPFNRDALLNIAKVLILQNKKEQGMFYFVSALRSLGGGEIQSYMIACVKDILQLLEQKIGTTEEWGNQSVRVKTKKIQKANQYIRKIDNMQSVHLDYLLEMFKDD